MARPVTIRGMNGLRRNLRKAPPEMRAEMVEATKTSADGLVAGMLQRVPRDSGDLASVIKAKVQRDGMSARVGPGARGKRDQKKAGYRAKFVEFGTVNMPAQPFVLNTAKEKRSAVRARFAEAVSAALLKLGGKG